MATYENRFYSSNGAGWITNETAITTAVADFFGGSNAVRQRNSSLLHTRHRSYTADSPVVAGDFLTVWTKGTASSYTWTVNMGDASRVNMLTGSIANSAGLQVVTNAIIAGWRKVTWKFATTVTGSFQFALDSPNLDNSFTPPNTTAYVDFLLQISSSPTALFYPTSGTPFTAIALPQEDKLPAIKLGNRLAKRGVILS